MNKYVVGFLFNSDTNKVCLIKKNRPQWQKGRLNGVGGHIEDGKAPKLL
jgi:8-oxo-dGTP diphosphatase